MTQSRKPVTMKKCIGVVLLLAVSAAGSIFAGEESGGTTWFYSRDPTGLIQVTVESELRWQPEKPQQLTARTDAAAQPERNVR